MVLQSGFHSVRAPRGDGAENKTGGVGFNFPTSLHSPFTRVLSVLLPHIKLPVRIEGGKKVSSGIKYIYTIWNLIELKIFVLQKTLH